MKKKILIILCLFAAFQFSSAQINYGIKGGLNYNLTNLFLAEPTNNEQSTVKKLTESASGYHAGVWLRAKVPIVGLYVRPEIVYTSIETEYEIITGFNYAYTLNKIDIPVLVGLKILSVGNVFVGPSFQYVLNSKVKVNNINLEETDTKNFSTGLQVGVGIELWKIGVDIRYETGLSSAENSFEEEAVNAVKSSFKIDTQPKQFILGFSYKF